MHWHELWKSSSHWFVSQAGVLCDLLFWCVCRSDVEGGSIRSIWTRSLLVDIHDVAKANHLLLAQQLCWKWFWMGRRKHWHQSFPSVFFLRRTGKATKSLSKIKMERDDTSYDMGKELKSLRYWLVKWKGWEVSIYRSIDRWDGVSRRSNVFLRLDFTSSFGVKCFLWGFFRKDVISFSPLLLFSYFVRLVLRK